MPESFRRAMPVQQRSAVTVEAILSASAELLVREGLPGFNTNAVAKVAGINVATLYHYFPNKNAILRELFDRDEKERTDYIGSQLEDLATTENLGEWIHDMVAALIRMRRSQPAGVALRRACRAVPELVEAEEIINAAVASRLAETLRRRFPALPAERENVAARALVEVTATLLDLAGDQPAFAGAMATELEAMVRGYFKELESIGPSLAEV